MSKLDQEEQESRQALESGSTKGSRSATQTMTRLWTDDDLAGMPPGRERAKAWVAVREQELLSLIGGEVVAWFGFQWPLRDEGPDGQPVYEDASVPFKQLHSMYLQVQVLGWLQISTHQDDIEWGLHATREHGSRAYKNLGGFCRRDQLEELPRGLIQGIELKRSARGNIDEIELLVAGRQFFLVAGEAREASAHEFHFVRGDESVCLFLSREALDSVVWC